VIQYPRTSESELPELYNELDRMLETADSVLREQFHVETNGNADSVVFADATEQDFLDALWADTETMVPFFQKVSGLPDREFERQYGISGIGSKLRGRKTDFRDEEHAQTFAKALNELLPPRLSVEALLFAFVKLWENDQRRHYRARYEGKVLDHLNDGGFPAFKGNKLPGEPDIVIPDTEPYEVTGEVRVIQQKDRKKRFKEFGSEARTAEEHFPDAKFVVVANVGRLIEREDREDVRDDIHTSAAAHIDGVFFQDELDELISQLSEWGVTQQQKLD